MARALNALSVLLVVGGFASLYIASTFLYLTPPNPVKLELYPVIYALEQPYFSQNWHLFAPNPVKSNFVLAVRCRLLDGAVTRWHDPVTPLLAAHHRNRLSPMGKVLRVPQHAIFAFLGRSTDEWRSLLCRHKPNTPICRRPDPVTQKQRDLGKFMLHRLSSAACDSLVGTGRSTAVQIRILLHKPPPFSQRHLPSEAGSTTYVTLPWLPYLPWQQNASSKE